MGLRTQVSALVAPYRDRAQHRMLAFAAARAVARFPATKGERHALPGDLIVSLTSHPPRYATLPMTLKSVLDQKVRADRTILWIADKDWGALTPEILALRNYGLEIERCDDVRSYNKIVHALARYPNAFIVTVDDDIYYSPEMLRRLTEGYLSGEAAICARRAHLIRRDANGDMAPYADWTFGYLSVPGEAAVRKNLFPTGVGGVLYPPQSFSQEVTDKSLFAKLCPTADDLWLYWMGRRAGAMYRQVGPVFPQIMWDGSQDVSLYAENSAGGNDRQIAALEAHFGKV
jgi:hypothetical protein